MKSNNVDKYKNNVFDVEPNMIFNAGNYAVYCRNVNWETDGDSLKSCGLTKKARVEIVLYKDMDFEGFKEVVSDVLSDDYGFLHNGFILDFVCEMCEGKTYIFETGNIVFSNEKVKNPCEILLNRYKDFINIDEIECMIDDFSSKLKPQNYDLYVKFFNDYYKKEGEKNGKSL